MVGYLSSYIQHYGVHKTQIYGRMGVHRRDGWMVRELDLCIFL